MTISKITDYHQCSTPHNEINSGLDFEGYISLDIDHKSKTGRVLNALMTGKNFNRYEAEAKLHELYLSSTISDLQKRFGIHISRKFETVFSHKGNSTQCCRYWISPAEIRRIQLVLAEDLKERTSGDIVFYGRSRSGRKLRALAQQV